MSKLKIKSYKNSFTFSKIIFCPFVFVYLLCVFVCFYYCFDFETVSYRLASSLSILLLQLPNAGESVPPFSSIFFSSF